MISVKRIADVRRATRPIAGGEQLFEQPGAMTDHLGEALEYVYNDADAVDRAIIEHTTGYGGTPVIPKNAIAAKLGVSPSLVTRKSEAISRRLQEMEHDLNQVAG